MGELKVKAPMLLDVFGTIVSASDHRNKVKVGSKHNPASAWQWLKERMSGLQSVVSLLLYVCHSDKQVL